MATAKDKTRTINIGDQAIQVAQLKSLNGSAVDVASLTASVAAQEAIAANAPVAISASTGDAAAIIAALITLGLFEDSD